MLHGIRTSGSELQPPSVRRPRVGWELREEVVFLAAERSDACSVIAMRSSFACSRPGDSDRSPSGLKSRGREGRWKESRGLG